MTNQSNAAVGVSASALADKVGLLERDCSLSYRTDYKSVKQSLYCILALLIRTPSIPLYTEGENRSDRVLDKSESAARIVSGHLPIGSRHHRFAFRFNFTY